MGKWINRELILCACGCGEYIENRDSQNRLRTKKKGHYTLAEKAHMSEVRICRVSVMKGKHFGQEMRDKARASHLGKKLTPEQKAKIGLANKGIWVGRKLSEETKQKIRDKRKLQVFSEDTLKLLSDVRKEMWRNPELRSKASIKTKQSWQNPEIREKRLKALIIALPRGENSSAWRGGLSFIPYTKDFNKLIKIQIRDRDNHTCQLCGMSEIENCKSLTVHHIDYDKAHSCNDNLISLCVSCNTKVNLNRHYWTSYFNKLLGSKVNA